MSTVVSALDEIRRVDPALMANNLSANTMAVYALFFEREVHRAAQQVLMVFVKVFFFLFLVSFFLFVDSEIRRAFRRPPRLPSSTKRSRAVVCRCRTISRTSVNASSA